MKRRATAIVVGILALQFGWPVNAQAPAGAAAFSIADVFRFPFPNELVAAEKAGRIAWALNEEGRRNIWVAEAPAFTPRKLTNYDEDDGQELTSVSLSPAGDWVVFVRGGDHGANWDDSVPVNPSGAPLGQRVAVWSVPFAGGEVRLLGDGDAPAVSPRDDVVAFEKDRQIWIAPIDASQSAKKMTNAGGTNGELVWSPDGSRLAFVSNRGDHSFIGVYVNERTPLAWLAASTSRDASPRWSPDGTRVAFVRRPGAGGSPEPLLERRHQPWAIWTADIATGTGHLVWKAPETLRGSLPTVDGAANLHWAARDRLVFLSYVDGFAHLYSMPAAGGAPLLLTPGSYGAEYIRLTPDRTEVVFAANAGSSPDDIDRRHLVRVPVDRATAEVLTPGTGLEWAPVVTGDRASIAFISAGPARPPLVNVMPVKGGTPVALGADRIPSSFPMSKLVTPRAVTFRASDGVTVHAQVFMPSSGGPARRPAIVYVHGGPQRQMLLGWHYMDYYAHGYAANQYLASRGFVVVSVNYRLGIGYGYEFHRPPAAGTAGASEYLDIKAAGEYLRALPDVDQARIGIYGGSYGGYLTALGLGRNSDLFRAGVDIHGVHDRTVNSPGTGPAIPAPNRFEPNDRERAQDVAWRSSPISAVGTWKSPVLLIHADDDRNVRFSQTVDLTRRLAAAGVPYEEIVIPDETHHFMRHANAVKVYTATATYLERMLMGDRNATPR